jgi:hypothetical protein
MDSVREFDYELLALITMTRPEGTIAFRKIDRRWVHRHQEYRYAMSANFLREWPQIGFCKVGKILVGDHLVEFSVIAQERRDGILENRY